MQDIQKYQNQTPAINNCTLVQMIPKIPLTKKIEFAKRRLDTTPEYDVIYADTKGRKIHLTSSELDKIYDDIEFFIRYRLEKEFDNVTRYKYKGDNPTWI